MPSNHEVGAASTTLATVLRQTALSIAEAQAALDAQAASEVARRGDQDRLPVLAFHFPEVEIDLQLAVSVGRGAASGLVVTPINPTSGSFFRTVSFQSRMRARIGPYLLVKAAENNDE